MFEMIVNVEKSVEYLKRCLFMLPIDYQSADSSQLTLVYFIVGSLDLLDSLHVIGNRHEIIEFIYSLQSNGGFSGGNSCCHISHLAMTYTALCSLLILKDDLSRVDAPSIMEHIRKLQQTDGSFIPFEQSGESDVRFSFCVAAICFILDDFSCIDLQSALTFITSCQAFDGGFAQYPGNESHGGSTYCAVAAFKLFGKLETIPRQEELERWLIMRQVYGFQGRVEKPADSCYCFWIGASIKILGKVDCVDRDSLYLFMNGCQTKYGGFSKHADGYPDLLHSYMSLAGLSLLGNPSLLPLDPSLNITKHTLKSLDKIIY